jgi:hypothetical protein
MRMPNHAMPIRQAHDQKPFGPEFIEGQPTAGRRTFKRPMTQASSPATTRVPASGG